MQNINRWNMFELELKGPSEENSFTDVQLMAEFIQSEEKIEVEGFYDGDGVYMVRFMPDREGKWTYKTTSDCEALNGIEGNFLCIAPEEGVHGKVKVANQYHFAYEDGTSYYPFGTTCYAWMHQTEELQNETLESLKNSGYNKLRMCVFPKFYSNNSTEPSFYPFEGNAPADWDYKRFNPAFFRHLDTVIKKLQEMQIEVDLILFHPYDKGHWGFDRMSADTDARYLHYIIARVGAYRNVWWSLANEYDYMKEKTKEDWDRNIALVAATDPYHHLLSIHQGDVLYDHWNANITHASIQMGTKNNGIPLGFGVYKAHRDVYHKPVIYDEVGYEGNLLQRWGSITAQELVDKFWKAIVSGAYMTHGETFTHPDDIVWWAKGGKLRGQSNARIQFLKKIVEESGIPGLEPLDHWWLLNGAGMNGKYYLQYFGTECPTEWKFELPAFKIPEEIPYGTKFKVEVIDAWNMTVTPIKELYEVTDQDRYHYSCNYYPIVELPGKPYMAIRITRV